MSGNRRLWIAKALRGLSLCFYSKADILAWWITYSLSISCFSLIPTPALADAGQCTATATNVAFGSLSVSTLTGATTTGSFSVTCPSGHGSYNPWAYCNSIGAGNNSASQSNRTMKSGSNSISYQLYTDSGYTNPYTYPGDTVYTWPYSNSNGSTAPSTVYAKILSSPSGIAPGTYTDTYNSGSEAVVNENGATTIYTPAENCTVTTGPNWWNTLDFTVSVTVLASCSVSTTAMNFGSSLVFYHLERQRYGYHHRAVYFHYALFHQPRQRPECQRRPASHDTERRKICQLRPLYRFRPF